MEIQRIFTRNVELTRAPIHRMFDAIEGEPTPVTATFPNGEVAAFTVEPDGSITDRTEREAPVLLTNREDLDAEADDYPKVVPAGNVPVDPDVFDGPVLTIKDVLTAAFNLRDDFPGATPLKARINRRGGLLSIAPDTQE